MHKSFFILCLLLWSATTLFAETTQASLQSVTVYTSGAELNHTAKMLVPSGASEIIIKNISGSLDENTIQVGSNNDLTILSVTFLREFLSDDVKSPAYQRLQDSLRQATLTLETLRLQITTHMSAIGILDANKVVRGEQAGLSVLELQKMVAYYLEKHTEISQKIQDLQQREKKQQETVTRIQNQINEQYAQRESGKGELRLQVLSPTNQQTVFTISYVSNQAAWSPSYDLKAKDTKSPLRIVYKAGIVQHTGLDWKQVRLSLSTNNPNQSGTIPVLSTWFLNYYSTTYGNQSDSYNTLRNDNLALNQVQAYGKAPASETGVNNHTQALTNAISTTFDIELNYDIPSDNKPHSVAMKEYEVAASYKYYAVPKMDREAFLVAEVADWESLNLMPGIANIIFDGTYVGKSFIDPNSTLDTLNISMGRDKKMVIKREKVQDFCSSKLIGSNRVHTVTYELKVKNTRKESVHLLLKDQLPISAQKDIEITVMEISDALRNEENGVLTWKLELAPNETRKLRIQYSVKYPKDKAIGPL